MRQLTEHEQRFIGGIIVMSIIAATPYCIMQELTRQPMIDWGKAILKTNDPLHSWGDQIKSGNYTNVYVAIFYVILVYAKILSICLLLKPSLYLTMKMGFPEQYPPNWRKYLNFHCKKCGALFGTRNKYNAHKKVCVISTLSQDSNREKAE